jgi:hypothetical protein
MVPVPEALRGIVGAMWDREIAADPARWNRDFLVRLAMGEPAAEARMAFFTACDRHRQGGPLAGIAHLPGTARIRKVLFPRLTARFGEAPVAASRMELIMIAARSPVPMRLWMDTASRGQGLRWSVHVLRLPEQRLRYAASFESLLGLTGGMSGWDRLRDDSLEAHAALLVERIAGTVAALSEVDWDAAGR